MQTPGHVGVRQRVDFSRIKTSIPIPNLIEVQKKSYDRFLQMDLLPSEREDLGLQAVFNSVFPIHDFRGTCSLEFVEYTIGNWECKCGNLKGLTHLRKPCSSCGHPIVTNPYSMEAITCKNCGSRNRTKWFAANTAAACWSSITSTRWRSARSVASPLPFP